MRGNIFYALILFSLVFLFCFGCGSDDDSDSSSSEIEYDDDSANDDEDDPPDAISSASPGHSTAILNLNHSGYKRTDCEACHGSLHNGAFTQGQCITCHGNNGAPSRPVGHATGGCSGCHEGMHPVAGMDSSETCTACHKFESGFECPVTEDYDVAIIGAGGGGLAAAASLALAGKKVVVIEKHYRVGGYMSSFQRGDYRFEISLHAINHLVDQDTGKLGKAYAAMGLEGRIDPIQLDKFYRSIFPGLDVVVLGEWEQYRAQLKELYPDQADGIDALFSDMDNIEEKLDVVFRLTDEFAIQDLMILLADLPSTLSVAQGLFIDFETYLRKFIDDPELIALFSQLCTFLGDAPDNLQALFFASMLNSYHKDGYFYLTGGSGALTQAIGDVIEENGGTIRLNTLATKIVIEDGRATQVQTLDDVCYNVDYVISNANAPDTMHKLIGDENLPENYLAKMEKMEIGVSILQIFMGVDGDFREYFQGAHEIMVNPLGDWNDMMEAVRTVDFPVIPYILVNYSEVDPTAAPEGKNVIALSTFMPYEWSDAWRWDQGYGSYFDRKEQVAAKFIEKAEEILPGLGDKIEVLEVGSPLTNQAFTLNPKGATYGWVNTPDTATVRRLSQKTPIVNVFLAGAWTQMGGGQATVIDSGLSAAKIVLEAEANK